MKVYLPSNGLLGTSSVELVAPTVGKLRKTVDLSTSSIIKRTELVQMHCDVDLNTITPSDRDYLYVILISSLYMDKITFTAECPNGHKSKDSISLEECTPLRLKKGAKVEITKKVGEVPYIFRKISVAQEIQIEEHAMEQDDDLYTQSFDDAFVAMILFGVVNPQSLDAVMALDLNVYYLALLFSKIDIHGVFLLKNKECPQCKVHYISNLPITGDMLNVNVSQLIDNYVEISGYISLRDFYDMTIPEYNTFVGSLNRKLNAQ